MSFQVFIAIAHTPNSQGASHAGITERMVSGPVSEALQRMLQEEFDSEGSAYRGCSVEFLIEGGNYTKAKAVKAKRKGSCWLALQIHLNSYNATGSCVLYRTDATKGESWALLMQKALTDVLNRGKHYRGIIPFPSDYRLTESGSQYKLEFLEELLVGNECQAIIVEVDSIRYGKWVLDNADDVADAIYEGVLDIIDSALGLE